MCQFRHIEELINANAANTRVLSWQLVSIINILSIRNNIHVPNKCVSYYRIILYIHLIVDNGNICLRHENEILEYCTSILLLYHTMYT